MKKITKQNGITLIALIITIIIMLILVGVTINVALNGGLFEKAKTAAEQTQREADREELLSAVYATLDYKGKMQVEIAKLEQGLSEGWDVETITNNEDFLKCTSAKGTIFYVQIETGRILDELPEGEPVVSTKSLSITPNKLELSGNGSSDTITLTSQGTFSGNVTWSIAPSGVVTVEGTNSSATITAVADSGTATITAIRDGVEAVCNVTVNDPNVWVDTYGVNVEYFRYGENYQSSLTNNTVNLALNKNGSVVMNESLVTAEQISAIYNNALFVHENYIILEQTQVDTKWLFVENNNEVIVYMYVRDGSTYTGDNNNGWSDGLTSSMFGAENIDANNGGLPLYYTPGT